MLTVFRSLCLNKIFFLNIIFFKFVVNIKPAGSISIRRKLSNTSKKIIEYQQAGGVPYPKNIKVRHPFFGVAVDPSSVKTEKQC